VLEHTAEAPNRVERGGEAPTIVAGSIVSPTVPLVVHGGEVDPELARRVRYDRVRPIVGPRIAL
jgi:hypothetical protein